MGCRTPQPRTGRLQGQGPACPRSRRAGAGYIRRVRRHQPRSPLGRAGGRAACQAFPAPGSRASPSEAPGRDGPGRAARSGRIPPTPPRWDGARLHRGSPACTARAALPAAGKPYRDPRGASGPFPIPHRRPSRGSGTPPLPHTGPTPTTRFPSQPGLSPPPASPSAEDGAPATARLPGLTGGRRGPAERAGAERSGAGGRGTRTRHRPRPARPRPI